MQSFAGKVKNELCRTPVQRLCCARAEAYGVLLYGNTFSPTEVRLITESADFAARLSPYGMSQSEFIRQAITRATIRPIVTVSPVNDELLAAVGKLTLPP